jgi:hypothetical protein
MLVFLFAFCVLVYYIREIWRAWISPEMKRDLAQLREQRKRRRAARRKG